MAIVREKCRSGGLSAEASQLVSASLRSKSTSSYESLFRKWNSWCMERSRDPTKGPIADVVNFLAELFHQGYQYRSLNAYRSAISSVHEKVDGEPVGQHPLVSQVLKGAFNERPPRPKYHSTWEVNLVLDMFRSEGVPSSLTLQKLTFRTVMLFALTRPCRGADLAALDLNNRTFCPEGVAFNPTQLSKQSRPSHFNVAFFFPSFQDDSRLCPVEALKEYEARTSQFRTDKAYFALSLANISLFVLVR